MNVKLKTKGSGISYPSIIRVDVPNYCTVKCCVSVTVNAMPHPVGALRHSRKK
jgi:hypothetical protein